MNVTGGKVLYNRSVQPAPYETKALGAEWSFSADDGEDAKTICKQMIADMMALVHAGLGLRAAGTAVTASPAVAEEAGLKVKKAAEDKAAETDKRKAAKAAAIEDARRAGAQAEPKPAAEDVIEPAKPMDFVLEPPGKDLIPDNELTAACSRAVERLGGPEAGAAVKIKGHIAKFRPLDHATQFQLKDIAQGRRQEFLDGLKALA